MTEEQNEMAGIVIDKVNDYLCRKYSQLSMKTPGPRYIFIMESQHRYKYQNSKFYLYWSEEGLIYLDNMREIFCCITDNDKSAKYEIALFIATNLREFKQKIDDIISSWNKRVDIEYRALCRFKDIIL